MAIQTFSNEVKMLASTPEYKAITSVPGWISGMSSGPDRINSTTAAYAYVPLVYRALRLRCDNLAAVPIYIEKGETAVAWPWPEADPYEMIWKTEAAMLLAGAGYWLKLDNKVRTRNLRFLNPFGMTVNYNRGEYQFVYSWTDGNDTQIATYSQDQIVYFREYNPLDDVLPGVAAGEVSLGAASLKRYSMRFASYFFENGAMPAVLLGIPQNTTEAERLRTENYFKRFMTGIQNAWRVLAVRAGMVDVKILTPVMKDLVIPELTEMAMADISAAFGIRKSILGDPANYATAKEDWDSFWKTTVRPRGRLYESTINKQLLARYGLSIRFAFDEMDAFQEDESRRAGSLKSLTDAGMPIDLAAEVLGYDLTEEQMLRLRESMKAPEPIPAPIVVNTPPVPQADPAIEPPPTDTLQADIKRWLHRSERLLREQGSAACVFRSDVIPASLNGAIAGALEGAKTPADLRRIFANAAQWGQYP